MSAASAGAAPAGDSGAAARIRIPRAFGPPALLAMGLSAIGSSILFVLGVVSKHALGLTPVVFVASAVFFVLTTMTYIEGNSIHPEQGGASTFARYAFDELWSFVAGWAILLDYLIVMALGILTISSYLAAFWAPIGHTAGGLLVAAAAVALVGWANIRGVTASRLGRLLRVGIAFLVVCVAIVVLGFTMELHLGRVIDSIHLGSQPHVHDLLFAGVLAAVASTGIEAASGLAPEIRVGAHTLRRLVVAAAAAVVIVLVGVSLVGTMAVPVHHGQSALGTRYESAPVLGIVSSFHPAWLRTLMRDLTGAVGALVLLQAVNGTMIGLSRMTYSLATNRQIPSLLGRLDQRRSTPYIAIATAAVIAFGLAASRNVEFLAGIFAFGAMLVFTVAHVSVIRLRFREPDRRGLFTIGLSVPFRGGSVPLPAAAGALAAAAGWLSVLVLHAGARYVGGVWMVGGIVLYVVYRRSQGKPLGQRFTIRPRALQETVDRDYGSILVPVFGTPLDDDIVGTAGRLAAEEGDEGEGGAVIEALYIVEMPMSLPLDARIPDDQITRAKRAVARAKQVGEEYEGVVVATAMVRARSVGAAIVSEARRRGVEAIVLAAEGPARTRGGALLGGRRSARDRSIGEMTRYVVDKAPCRVILTAAPDEDVRPRDGEQDADEQPGPDGRAAGADGPPAQVGDAAGGPARTPAEAAPDRPA